jgi:hypothetical protein
MLLGTRGDGELDKQTSLEEQNQSRYHTIDSIRVGQVGSVTLVVLFRCFALDLVEIGEK